MWSSQVNKANHLRDEKVLNSEATPVHLSEKRQVNDPGR